MMPHVHDETGNAIFGDPDPGPTPEESAADAVKSSARTEADAEVEIARIEADTAIKLAKLAKSGLDDEERIELEALRLEVSALRGLAAPEPAPAPEPVAVAVADPGPDDAPPPVEENHESHEGSEPPAPRRKGSGIGFW